MHSAVIQAALDAVVVIDRRGVVVELNAAAEQMFGYAAREAAGRELAQLIIPLALRGRHKAGLARYLRTGRARVIGTRVQLTALRRDGTEFPVELAIAEIPAARGQRLFAGYIRDLSEKQREDALRAGHSAILERIAAGAPLAELLAAIVLLIESNAPEVLASILLLDTDGVRVRHGAAGSLPQEYWRAIDGASIGPQAGSCGTAMYRREAVITEDLERDPLWKDYRALAAPHGLRACWSTPILDPQRRVLGSFALYRLKPGKPKARHLRLIEMATHTAAIAIQKTRDDAQREGLLQQVGVREAMFRSIFENAAIGMSMTGMDGKFVRCNPALSRMLGYSEQEIAGRSFTEFTHPDDIEPNLLQYRALAAGKLEHFQLEKRYLRKDGSVIWVDLTVSMMPAASDGKRFSVGMMEDITARKLAEASLRDSEYRHRGILESMTVGFIAIDRRWRLAYANPRAAEIVGRPAETFVGKTFHEAFPEAVGSPFEADYLKAMNERVTLMSEHYFDAWQRWFEVRVDPSPEGIAIFFRDVTEQKRGAQELRESQERYRRLVEVSPDAIFVLQDEKFAFANRAALELFGAKDAGELLGRPIYDVTHPDFHARAAVRLKALTSSTRIVNPPAEHVLLRLDGTPFDVEVSSVGFTLDDKPAVQVIARDVTERRRSLEALHRFRAAMDASGDAILLVDRASMRYVDVNQTFCDLLGRSREEIIGMTPMDLFSATRAELERDYDAIIAGSDHSATKVEGNYRRADGTLIPVETRRSALRTKDGWIIVGSARDLSERKLAEKRIEYLATHDSLTGLPNRNLLADRITHAIARARRHGGNIALLYLDLDRFKVINDGFGHPFGDAVLKAVGARLGTIVREMDTVARQGGDEFFILLSELRRSADVHVIAQKVLEALERPFVEEGREIHLTTSIGVCVFPSDGQAAEALIGNADVAMYRAKDFGGNAYQFFTRELSAETLGRVEIETRLRAAVARGELHLAYQPKVDLGTGRITGCEALLRWTHPELGAVSPARFIPVAEDSGLIVPIGDWVLRTACAQNKAWRDAGLPPITVAVNISARQFLRQDVVAWVKKTLEETGLAPELLELELTESLIAQDVEKVIQTINQLKGEGVRFSIDDFGTGYSSLSYLKRFRVDTLKIDQSFVRNMLSDSDDATIALAIISLAHSLRMKVIAEGVETAQHCELLLRNGCDEIQGYHFSRPVAANEMQAMLKTGKRLAATQAA